jgi:hypothetical protein
MVADLVSGASHVRMAPYPCLRSLQALPLPRVPISVLVQVVALRLAVHDSDHEVVDEPAAAPLAFSATRCAHCAVIASLRPRGNGRLCVCSITGGRGAMGCYACSKPDHRPAAGALGLARGFLGGGVAGGAGRARHVEPEIRFMPRSWRASEPEQDSRHYSRKVGRVRKTVFTEGGDEKDGNINH